MSTTASERVAVLDREGLHIEGYDYDVKPSPTWARQASLGLLVHVCRARRVSELWIHESAEMEAEEWAVASGDGWKLPEKPAPWQTTWQPGTWGRVALVLPALESRTVWHRAATGRELLAAILAFRRAAGISYRSSPGATGQALMRECAPRIDFTASLAPAEMPEPAKGNTESDFFWMRPLTAEERAMRYVHAFDKNAMYLAACGGLKLGFGKPEHITGGHKAWAGQPGYWRVGPGSRHDEDILPPVMPERAAASWVSTPTLKVSLEAYASIGFHDAWVYPESHEPLTPWARRVRAARKELMHSNPIAYQVLKDSYRWAIGWLNYRGIKDSTEPEDLYRPDWRHAIIATARANMYRNAAKALLASGHAPFAIATDCLYYASDLSRADTFAGVLGLRLGDGVGGYKVNASVALADVRDCIELGSGRGLKALRERLSGWKREEAGHDGDSDREEPGE